MVFELAESCGTLRDVVPSVRPVISRLLAARIHQNCGPRGKLMIRLRSCFTFIACFLKESEAKKERSRRDQG